LVLETSLSGEQREHLEIARTSAESLHSLLNDILDFSKIEAARLDLNLSPFLSTSVHRWRYRYFPRPIPTKGSQSALPGQSGRTAVGGGRLRPPAPDIAESSEQRDQIYRRRIRAHRNWARTGRRSRAFRCNRHRRGNSHRQAEVEL